MAELTEIQVKAVRDVFYREMVAIHGAYKLTLDTPETMLDAKINAIQSRLAVLSNKETNNGI